ncbi:hypothetical protein AcetOrient_orf01681 [Acetobacter orientalis]|uniref:Uncharacterized protein n=1 Tax=Acetobacter orientalis TaxID=146474 RepID=A0A2Z5ZFG7_9PROT|nr:hypothetical protein AcetOrient_orf01681 [Acetobacter orientalis]
MPEGFSAALGRVLSICATKACGYEYSLQETYWAMKIFLRVFSI